MECVCNTDKEHGYTSYIHILLYIGPLTARWQSLAQSRRLGSIPGVEDPEEAWQPSDILAWRGVTG